MADPKPLSPIAMGLAGIGLCFTLLWPVGVALMFLGLVGHGLRRVEVDVPDRPELCDYDRPDNLSQDISCILPRRPKLTLVEELDIDRRYG